MLRVTQNLFGVTGTGLPGARRATLLWVLWGIAMEINRKNLHQIILYIIRHIMCVKSFMN